MKKTFVLTHQEARRRAINMVMTAPEGSKVAFSDATRSLDQNALLWPLLEAFSKQVEWTVNGEQTLISADDWKDILTAGFKLENRPVRVASGVDGGAVILGTRTSTMGKREFSEFIEFIYATGAGRGVDFGDDSREIEKPVPPHAGEGDAMRPVR